MTWFCLLCVSLVLAGWAMRREVHTAFEASDGNDLIFLHYCFAVPSRLASTV